MFSAKLSHSLSRDFVLTPTPGDATEKTGGDPKGLGYGNRSGPVFIGTEESGRRRVEKSFSQGLLQLAGTGEEMTATAVVSGDSAWYAGHFPGNPVLPGIAILALVEEAIVTMELREGSPVLITGLSRVRFRLPVKPDDLMTLEIRREKKRTPMMAYHFSVNLAGEAACTGTFSARPAQRSEEQTS